jgi:hypothetical protein
MLIQPELVVVALQDKEIQVVMSVEQVKLLEVAVVLEHQAGPAHHMAQGLVVLDCPGL